MFKNTLSCSIDFNPKIGMLYMVESLSLLHKYLANWYSNILVRSIINIGAKESK